MSLNFYYPRLGLISHARQLYFKYSHNFLYRNSVPAQIFFNLKIYRPP